MHKDETSFLPSVRTGLTMYAAPRGWPCKIDVSMMLVRIMVHTVGQYTQISYLCVNSHLLPNFIDGLLSVEERRLGAVVIVRHRRLVRHQHGRGAEHVAERVVQEVQHGRGVQVSVSAE